MFRKDGFEREDDAELWNKYNMEYKNKKVEKIQDFFGEINVRTSANKEN